LIVRDRLKAFRLDQHGTTAVEFAIVAPVFIALLVGTLALCVGLFLIGSLHYAVEEGARCASVKAACQVNGIADATATQTYAQNHYFGPNVSPTFTYNAAPCGNSVSASISYSMNVGFKTLTVPISATACFP
jgi:Flp pilus assembly protein TadG